MTRSELYALLGTFERTRTAQGDRFCTSRHLDGHFFYETDGQGVAIVVWGSEQSWRLSVFACARVGMRPTFELYRYVSRWRSTSGVGAPYVVEDGPAAVMCETTIDSSQLVDDVSAWRLISSTIDRVGDTARRLGHDLARADGVPFTAEGDVGLTLALGWWEVRDERVERALSS